MHKSKVTWCKGREGFVVVRKWEEFVGVGEGGGMTRDETDEHTYDAGRVKG